MGTCDFNTYTYCGGLEVLTISKSGRTYLNLDLCDLSNIILSGLEVLIFIVLSYGLLYFFVQILSRIFFSVFSRISNEGDRELLWQKQPGSGCLENTESYHLIQLWNQCSEVLVFCLCVLFRAEFLTR